jgi:hypothetical protein
MWLGYTSTILNNPLALAEHPSRFSGRFFFVEYFKMKLFTVNGPVGSRKTTAAISFAGHSIEKAGEKIVIAQPSKDLIDQSLVQFQERFPRLKATAIHSGNANNVADAIAEHTKQSRDGELLFVTHAALMMMPYWNRQSQWHLIVDEAPDATYNYELVLPANYPAIVPALAIAPFNVKYSRLVPGDDGLLSAIGNNQGDLFYRAIEDFARKLKSHRWDMFVLNEQFDRFVRGNDGGKLLVFGLLDHEVFRGFQSVTVMAANLFHSIFYKHMIAAGHSSLPHPYIQKRLHFDAHTNGHLLTIYYATEASWSKHQRNQEIRVDDDLTINVNQLIVSGALDVFGDEPFVKLVNKPDRLIRDDPFGRLGVALPHSSHGLNSFQEFHNAAILPALNLTPAFYAFLDEVSHLDSDEVRTALYHEKVYQAAGRISIRNPDDLMPKRLVLADKGAAEAVAALYPGAAIKRLPFADLLPDDKLTGRPRKYATKADENRAYRAKHKAELLAGLNELNRSFLGGDTTNRSIGHFHSNGEAPAAFLGGETTNRSIGHFHSNGARFGGSLFASQVSKLALSEATHIAFLDFIEFLRELHARAVVKDDMMHWSPAIFVPDDKSYRARQNIASMWGVWLDCDNGTRIGPHDLAAMLPHLMMVVYNSSSSTRAKPRYRVVIPTTAPMTYQVHQEVTKQIREVLRKKGFYDKHQLIERAERGLGGEDHGFDPDAFRPEHLYGLPIQALAGAEHSFFMVFDDQKRTAIDPYVWVDRTIITRRQPTEHVLQLPSPEEFKVLSRKALEIATAQIEAEVEWGNILPGDHHQY